MRGGEKITAAHLERIAVIYIRQSSLAQVRENTESTARQYALADEAVRLGWARSSVEVIDADLGLSGRSADGRSGYKELVGRVCVGESAPFSASRCPAWPAPRPICPACWSWPA